VRPLKPESEVNWHEEKTMLAKSATRSMKRAATPFAGVESHVPAPDVQVRIAVRAHELYVQRGCLDGYHLHDWLEAEQEIVGNAQVFEKTAARM
jgi:hypothetical protein